jgi:serine/threonine-protein kinase
MKRCPKCGAQYEDAITLCPADGEALERDDDPLIGQTLAGKYRIEERIGLGGMGAVYRATHIMMDKAVAIKVLRPSLAADEKLVARFSREARAASRITHPHAITVTDFGEAENGLVFLVMEYLRGQTLREVIESEGPLPLLRVLEIIRQVSGALDAAHAQGIVHRDLKSDNIMLESVNGQDWAKVLDFGIAKVQETAGETPTLTATNLIIGTPQYMAPEQCSKSVPIDARTDIYSLGVILFEMLTGHVPFASDSPTATMLLHVQEPVPSVLKERKDLPPAIDQVVARAMAKRPADRYQSAGELAEALFIAVTEDPAMAAGAVSPSDLATIQMRMAATGVAPEKGATAPRKADEPTVVRPTPGRVEIPVGPQAAAPGPAEGFRPWRIMAPALAALAAIFIGAYALTHTFNGPATEGGTPPAAGSSGQPVSPATPPTGEGEKHVAPHTTVDAAKSKAANKEAAGQIDLPQLDATPTPARTRRPKDTEGTSDADDMIDEATDESAPEPRPTPTKRPGRQPSASAPEPEPDQQTTPEIHEAPPRPPKDPAEMTPAEREQWRRAMRRFRRRILEQRRQILREEQQRPDQDLRPPR